MYRVYQPSEMYDEAHGMVIPFVVLGILWWKRKELLALPLRTWTPGVLVFLLGLLFHLIGYRVQQPRISILGLFVGIYGICGMAWGAQWLKYTMFPFVLFIFCVPMGTFEQVITVPLRLMVSRTVEVISHNILAIDVLRNGTTLSDPTGHYGYDVAAPCSGIRSLIATVLMALVYGMLSFKTWWKRGVLLASAVPLAVIGNIVRMLSIIIAAELGGASWGNAVHDGGPLGIWSLLPYVPPLFGLMWLGRWLREPAAAQEPGKLSPAVTSREPEAATTAA